MPYNQVLWQSGDAITSQKLQTMCNNTDLLYSSVPQTMQVRYGNGTVADGVAPGNQQNRGRPVGKVYQVTKFLAAYVTFDFSNDPSVDSYISAPVNFFTFGIYFPQNYFSYSPITSVTLTSGGGSSSQLMSCMITDDSQANRVLVTVWYADLKARPFHGAVNVLSAGY